MRIDLRAGVVTVVLSRRNVLSLLHKLEMPDSARTILGYDTYVDGQRASGLTLAVQVEDHTRTGRPEMGAAP